MNRRDLLKGLAVGAAASTIPLNAQAALPALDPGAIDPSDGPSWLLAPYQLGQEVAFGWHLGLIESNDRGAWVLNLHHREGRGARVHICYHDGTPKGVGHTELLDLILMDGGAGARKTEEHLARVVRHLGDVMRQNELREGADDELARLKTHSERVALYGPESLI